MSERQVGHATVIELSGKLVASDDQGKLKERVTNLVHNGQQHIVLNLAGLTYVDSSGLGEMVACHGTARRAGGAVRLANIGERLQDLLVITRLVTVFDSYDSEEAALASFGGAPA
jgi:anti-sigma B factor antagonist